ncbi:uncharacterized protein A4U43_C08F1400 [Asparagus officinalis]|nr:uncharacterized protein A4U43_C08F1400 [Asparagus officinalis]
MLGRPAAAFRAESGQRLCEAVGKVKINIRRSILCVGVEDSHIRSGFISSDMYQYGLFSASIKLPSDYTAGIVVAFYMSNGDVFRKNHDELDFEFLGNIWGKQWRIQTNIYGNGSTSRGREERYYLPFDPTKESHRYSILWTTDEIILISSVEMIGNKAPTIFLSGSTSTTPRSALFIAAMGGDYPSNHVRLRHHLGPRRRGPDLVVLGCPSDPIQDLPSSSASDDQCSAADDEITASSLAVTTPEKMVKMRAFRERYMSYSVCYDSLRYPVAPEGCDVVEEERARFKETGHRMLAVVETAAGW